VHLHQSINISTKAEPSHSTTTSIQATAGAPRQPLSWAPSPIHTSPGSEEPDHVQIDDWDDEAEEDAATTEEEELAKVQQEIGRLRLEQESILSYPNSERSEPKLPHVCPGCSNHTNGQ
jgi:hypothetical protein